MDPTPIDHKSFKFPPSQVNFNQSEIPLSQPFLGSISNIDVGPEYHCTNKTHVRKVISGVVGAASSVTSIQVANLLRLFRIPQVSPAH